MHAQAQPSAPARNLGQVRQVLSVPGAGLHDADEDGDTQEVSLAALLSSDLLRGQKAVSIRHNGSVYRLQATRLGKLILTK
jgi:hemin uptake protein HemP